MLTSFHSSASFLFALYGTFHVAQHFLAAIFYNPEWHVKTQDAYMIRGKSEKLLIWLPTGLSFVSGMLLLLKNRRQLFAAWRWAFGDINGKFDWVLKTFTNFAPRSGGGYPPTNHQQNIIHIQYLSASLLGLCLCAHLPAVFGLRFVFNEGKAINVYAAAHAMHDSNLPWIGRFLFKNYYAILISSFFIHAGSSTARWLLKEKYKEVSQAQNNNNNKTNTEDLPDTKRVLSEYARRLFVRVVVPVVVGAIVVGYSTVWGIASKTSEESCAPHWPIK